MTAPRRLFEVGDRVSVEFDSGPVPGVVVKAAVDTRRRQVVVVQTVHGYVGAEGCDVTLTGPAVWNAAA